MGAEQPAELDPELLAAYRAAEYVVPIGGQLCRFQIDQPTPPALTAWLAEEGPAGWLSAFNPGSRQLPILENIARHESLWRRLRAEGFPALAGYAADPEGVWPDETSLLIPGIDLQRLSRLALEFDQLGFLWLEPGQPARLWLTAPSGGRPAPSGRIRDARDGGDGTGGS